MYLNSNEKCPVCSRQFTQEDDIVICPICGTPHHRECYNSLGHCINSDKHGTDFEYAPQGADEPKQSQGDFASDTQEGQYYVPPQSSDHPSENARQENQDGREENKKEQNTEKKFYETYFPNFPNMQYSGKYANDTRTVGGKNLEEVAAVVNSNADRFIPKFLKNKKISWNWSAFIFGPYYLFFRKMYEQGIIFMALNLAATLVLNGVFSKEIVEYMSFISSNIDSFYNPTQEFMSNVAQANSKIMPFLLLSAAATFVIHLIIALFADAFYRSKVINVLNKVEKNLEEGATFNMTPMLDGSNLSQKDMKKLYLGKMGGTSFFSPVVAYCVLNIITDIISRL